MEPKLQHFTIEVMAHLSHTEWKTEKEVRDEMGAEWKKRGRRKYMTLICSLFSKDFASMIQAPGAYLSVAFNELETKGLAVYRPCERHGKTERKLTEEGHRVITRLARAAGAKAGILVQKPV